MKNASLTMSKFAHVLEGRGVDAGVTAYVHSFYLDPVYRDETPEIDAVIALFKGREASVEDVLAAVPAGIRGKVAEAIELLRDAKVLVSSAQEDDILLAELREAIAAPPYPDRCYFVLSDNCNFGCDYCFLGNQSMKARPMGSMSRETALRGLEHFAKEIGRRPEEFDKPKAIWFYGGEPLLNVPVLGYVLEKIAELQQEGRLPRKTLKKIITNGSLITPAIARLLKKHEVEVGISVDGIEDTSAHRTYHDKRPTFRDALRGFRLLQEAGVEPGISCAFSEEVMGRLDDVLTHFKELLGERSRPSFSFNILKPRYGGVAVAREYTEKASAKIIEAFEKAERLGVSEETVRSLSAHFYPKEDGSVRSVLEKYRKSQCAGTGRELAFRPDGSFGPCHAYYREGTHFSHDYAGFDLKADPTFAAWARRTPINMPGCVGEAGDAPCASIALCGGGCARDAEKSNGDIMTPEEHHCVTAKAVFDWLIWDTCRNTLAA